MQDENVEQKLEVYYSFYCPTRGVIDQISSQLEVLAAIQMSYNIYCFWTEIGVGIGVKCMNMWVGGWMSADMGRQGGGFIVAFSKFSSSLSPPSFWVLYCSNIQVVFYFMYLILLHSDQRWPWEQFSLCRAKKLWPSAS